MQTVPGNLYDYPRYYDLLFGNDWKAEFDFLIDCFDRFVPGKVHRLFEPACGTGRLIYRLAKAGFDVAGLDLNPRAVRYCNRRLARHDLPETAFVGDMCDFRLPQPIDAAFNTINSFRHLLSEQAALAHLRCVAAALRPGGIYVLGLHLMPTEGTPLTEESWSARRGDLRVHTHLQTFETDLRKRLERCRMTLNVDSPTKQLELVDELVFRTYTLPEMERLLAEVGELELAGVYDFRYRLDLPQELLPDTQDVVLVLQKC